MKFKSILLTAVATLGLTAATMAQVPNYLPTNGLVGWWPFNGNANDESGNGNNGTVNGASLTSDRFGISNSAYVFNSGNYISVNDTPTLRLANTDFTINSWVYLTDTLPTNVNYGQYSILSKRDFSDNTFDYLFGISAPSYTDPFGPGRPAFNTSNISGNYIVAPDPINLNQWVSLTVVYEFNTGTVDLYIFDNLVASISGVNSPNADNNTDLWIGNDVSGSPYFFHGKLDDIGIWNRALTQQEITDLYNAVNCSNNTTINPQTNSLVTGGTASFTATTSDPNPSYVWQSDLGQGFQTLNNFGNYTGTNTGTLNIANVQLPNHTQPVRVITTSGNCIDTSNVAVINILDTCITNVTVYDTLFTTVTDTLVINATITGINPPNNLNTLKVFPNPASTHITIDYGNFASMSGYTLKITNNLGQVVFTSPINQQSSYIDLSTWTGNGIYFIQIIDTQNNTIENRKIVIQ
jgi:hypothetical protein